MNRPDTLPAIFAALEDEIRIVRSKMVVDERIHLRPSLITRGQLNNRPCLLIQSGMGRKAMGRALDYCLPQFKPAVCLNIGYAGGTTPYMSAGDLVIADVVTDANNRQTFSLDSSLVEQAETLCKKKELKALRGGLVTVDQVVKTPHEKAFVGTEYNALGVDMESSIFVEKCSRVACPCIVVRAILDSLDVVVPDMTDAVDDAGEVSISQVAGHILSNPKDVWSLPKIEYLAIKAREAIAAFVEAWMVSL